MSIRDYKITDEQFNEKGMTSLPDTLKGTPYENKRSLEKFTREVVAPNFNAIVEDFAQMEESAENWSAEEAQRVQQENARQTAEQGRASMEGQRETNETARLLAEENRISAENDRVTAETARANAENKRDSAEKSRVAAENARNFWQTYDASKAYVPGNKVSFDGSSYVCTAATTGHEPTDTAYWLLIAQKGKDGAGADDLQRIDNALDAVDPTKITAKAAPADGDGVMIADSADGDKAKRLLWSSVKAALGKLFVPLARKVNGKALSADVTLTGENIAVSTTDPTPISGALKYRCNPNLLDNWYFANPANQRNGYIVPAGVEYYKVDGFVPQGPIPETVRVDYIDYAGSAIFNYGGVPCYVPKGGGYVRGYTGSGYTVDRWKLDIDIGTVTAESDGIVLDGGSTGCTLYELQEPALLSMLEGQTLTWSAMYTILSQTGSPGGFGSTVPGSYVARCIFSGSVGVKNVASGSAVMPTNPQSVSRFYIPAGCKIKIHAVKVELGDQQTLAHKENDKWVLNEIPDYGEQLRRCQRYARAYKCLLGQTFLPLGAYRSDRKAVSFALPTSSFRAVPTVSTLNDIFQLFDGANVYPITSLAVTDYSDGLVTIYAYTSQPFEIGKVLWLFSNTGTLLLSADL